jgi:hypothetical protein
MKQELINTIATFLSQQELNGEDLGSLENLLLSSYLKVAQGEEAFVLLASHDPEEGVTKLLTCNVSDTVKCLRSLAEEIEENGSL